MIAFHRKPGTRGEIWDIIFWTGLEYLVAGLAWALGEQILTRIWAALEAALAAPTEPSPRPSRKRKRKPRPKAATRSARDVDVPQPGQPEPSRDD